MIHRDKLNYDNSPGKKVVDARVSSLLAMPVSYFRYLRWQLHCFLGRAENIDVNKISATAIPVIINNYNRLDPLKKLVDWLISLDEELAIIIVDNDSDYPPLLRWYSTIQNSGVQVLKLNFNSHLFGISRVVAQLPFAQPFVVTDSDLVPFPEMPSDVLVRLQEALHQYPQLNHVGLSLEIADLPACYPLRNAVQTWESQFWRKPLGKLAGQQEEGTVVFDAAIDTTFALYRPGAKVEEVYKSARLDRPYTLQHVDWYVDPDHLSSEYQHYLSTASAVASWAKTLQEVSKK